jgi:hypothetical protein
MLDCLRCDIVEIVYCYVFYIAHIPLHVGIFAYIAGLEQHLQYGHDCCKREEREQRRQDVEEYIEREIVLVRRNKSAQYGNEIFHTRFSV